MVVPIPVMVPAPAGTSDSRSNVPVPVSGVEEGKKTDTDTDSGAGITSPLAHAYFGHILNCPVIMLGVRISGRNGTNGRRPRAFSVFWKT